MPVVARQIQNGHLIENVTVSGQMRPVTSRQALLQTFSSQVQFEFCLSKLFEFFYIDNELFKKADMIYSGTNGRA